VTSYHVRVLKFSRFEPDHFVSAGKDSIRCYRMRGDEIRGISIKMQVRGSRVAPRCCGESPQRFYEEVAFSLAGLSCVLSVAVWDLLYFPGFSRVLSWCMTIGLQGHSAHVPICNQRAKLLSCMWVTLVLPPAGTPGRAGPCGGWCCQQLCEWAQGVHRHCL
jgi:hypothetical protein